MKRGSGPDGIKSSWCLCCSHSDCSWRISSVFECAGVWLFWSVSANRGCSWQGSIWVIASKHWEDVLYCIAGHETAYFHPPPPCSTPSWWHTGVFTQIWSLLSHLISKSLQIQSFPPPAFLKCGGSAWEILHSWMLLLGFVLAPRQEDFSLKLHMSEWIIMQSF